MAAHNPPPPAAPPTGGVDLHMHSTASDGDYAPEKLVAEAEALGLEAIGITDHDTVAGIEPALEAAKTVRVVPGIEITCDVPEGHCHILGFFIRHDSPFLVEPLEFLRARRRTRAGEMTGKLASLGMKIELPERRHDHSVGRPHLANALVRAGHVGSVEEAFQRFLAEGRPAYVPAPRLKPHEAIEMIMRAGGTPVLAHPHTYDNEMKIQVLASQGLCGIEAEYVTYDRSSVKRWKKMAARLGLLATAGSDFHGPSRPDRRLGTVRSSASILEELLKKRRPIP